MQSFYPLRRVPESFPATYLWRQVAPLFVPIARSSLLGVWAERGPLRDAAREALREAARERGDAAAEKAQRTYFDRPGLDTLTVRELAKVGRSIARLGRTYLWLRIAAGLDKDGRARHNLALVPRRGYDSLMLTGLAVGTALGYFSGGPVHSLLWWDSARESQGVLPEGHVQPAVRRFQPPLSLGDLSADIDDLYWAEAYGQAIKITRVGVGDRRRWLVSLPGTDHSSPASEPNTADLESNVREELNIPSAMRIGTIRVIHEAMRNDGIVRPDRVRERVLICGHSQGGMVAVALGAMDPQELGFSVDGVVTLGSPARRLKLRPEVAMLAVEHDQDIVPALDGTPRKEVDQRVVLRRKLSRPRTGPLFYAHASSTYTETLRQIERQETVAPWGRAGKVVATLREFLPQVVEDDLEPTRVTHHYTWQEVLEPTKSRTWDRYLTIERPDWEPVTFGGEVDIDEELPATPRELLERAEGLTQDLLIKASGLLPQRSVAIPGEPQESSTTQPSESADE